MDNYANSDSNVVNDDKSDKSQHNKRENKQKKMIKRVAILGNSVIEHMKG